MELPFANGGPPGGAGQNGVNAHGDHDREAPQLRLRLLCPHALVPALIGKRGDNIKRIRRESGAAVSVAEPVLSCDERVVHITGESVDAEGSSAAADALCGVFISMCSLQAARRGEGSVATPPAASPPGSAAGAAAGDEPTPPASGPGSVADGAPSSAASTADGASLASSAVAAAAAAAAARPGEARLLVESNVVGFLVGRGGATIKDTMARSGAGVRVLPKRELPACAAVSDEVVRVAGSGAAVSAALRVLASQIKSHVRRHGVPPTADGYANGGPPALMLGTTAHPDMGYLHPALAPPPFFPGGHAGPGGVPLPPPPAAYSGTAVEVTFRLLAPAGRTGNVIGKGGEHVRRVRAETGARIKVFDPAPRSDDRVVALTSSEDAMSPYCAAQDALIRCVVALTADDAPGAAHRVRLLTAQASVGMVLGKRGATVSQLRQETGASIKVLPTDPVPPAFGGGLGGDGDDAELASSISSGGGSLANGGGGGGALNGCATEEIVQVEGNVQQCVAALRGVATLLRGWQIRRLLALQQQQFGPGPPPVQPGAPLPVPVSPTGSGMLSPTSPSMLGVHLPSSLGSPAQPGYLVSPNLQAAALGAMGLGSAPPMPMPPPPRGLTFVYHLSNAQVGAVLGKGGAHIAQIRNMSGARVQLQGESEGGRVLLVAGQPEQCHAAHAMANAFLSMGRCEPAFPEPILGG